MPTSTTTRAADARSWRDLLGEHFVDLDVAAAGPLRGDARSRAVGNLQLSRVSSVDQQVHRTPGLTRSDGRRFVQIGLLERGSGRVLQDGRECWLEPGDYALYETCRPFSWELRAPAGAPAWSLLVLTWSGVELAGSTELTARRLDGRHGLTGVLGRMISDLVGSDVEGDDPGDRLAGELLGLVTVAATPGREAPAEPSTGDRALLGAVRTHVEEHLADPGLGPGSIAAAHFVSVRQLHRLFADQEETVARYVRHRRLERARQELLRAGPELSLTALAHRCGFTDLGVFGRAFRAAYGTTPSRFRAQAAARRG
jgi:AraC-like DNA-binding protein